MQTANQIQLSPKHFEMLRLAKLRGLKVRSLGVGVYAVTSHTRKSDGIEWAVSDGICSCPSIKFCTHAAAAMDFHFTTEAEPSAYVAYSKLNSDDRLAFRLRIRSGETTRNDRIYIRFAMKFYERRREAAKRAGGVRRVETKLANGRTKVREYAGHFQI